MKPSKAKTRQKRASLMELVARPRSTREVPTELTDRDMGCGLSSAKESSASDLVHSKPPPIPEPLAQNQALPTSDSLLQSDASLSVPLTDLKYEMSSSAVGVVERMRPHADSHPKGLDVDRFSAGIVETLSTSKIIPKALRPHLDFINQGIAVIAAALKALAPYAERASALVVHIWTFADQNKLFDFVSFACGFVMLFFGGSFALLIGAVEAYRISGWTRTRKCLKDLYYNYLRVRAADKYDDELLHQDMDQNGTPDLEDMSDEQYVMHKVALILRIVQPQQVFDAVSGISLGFFAVLATLKVKFAKTVTLGNAMGGMFESLANRVLLDELRRLAGDYRKWVAPLIQYACRWLGMCVAWTLQRALVAMHSCVRGAYLVIRGIATLSRRYTGGHNVVPHENDIHGRPLWAAAVAALAAVGFVKQVYVGFVIPVPLSLVFLPFRIAEATIQCAMYFA